MSTRFEDIPLYYLFPFFTFIIAVIILTGLIVVFDGYNRQALHDFMTDRTNWLVQEVLHYRRCLVDLSFIASTSPRPCTCRRHSAPDVVPQSPSLDCAVLPYGLEPTFTDAASSAPSDGASLLVHRLSPPSSLLSSD